MRTLNEERGILIKKLSGSGRETGQDEMWNRLDDCSQPRFSLMLKGGQLSRRIPIYNVGSKTTYVMPDLNSYMSYTGRQYEYLSMFICFGGEVVLEPISPLTDK